MAVQAVGTPDGSSLPEAAPLPAMLRRRVTPIGRKALEAAWAILPLAGDSPRLVLSSRHGEYTRTMGLLLSLADEDQVSPAEFSLAVHHALVGLLSIASGNRAGHTAIAAGEDSFGYGLLEAAVSAAEDRRPVVLIHFDEPLSADYAAIAGPDAPAIALALVILPDDAADGERVTLSFTAREGGDQQPLAEAFVAFLDSHRPEASCPGGRMMWRWHRG